MSIRAAIHHLTHYKYDPPVSPGPQIIRLRPAPHSRTRVISHSLKVSPANHFVNHQQDPYGNWLARYVFPELVKRAEDRGRRRRRHDGLQSVRFFCRGERGDLAVRISRGPRAGPRRLPHARARRSPASRPLERDPPTPRRTVDFVVDLNRRLAGEIQYLIRMEPGVQTPEETFERGSGRAAIPAWLLVQILRNLGWPPGSCPAISSS